MTPAALRNSFHLAWRDQAASRAHHRLVNKGIEGSEEASNEDGLIDAWRVFVNKKGRDAPTLKQKRLARQLYTGTLATNQLLHKRGYEVEDCCPLCGNVGDTARHRLWLCESVKVTRAKYLAQEDVDFFAGLNAGDIRAQRGWKTSLGAQLPMPGDDLDLQWDVGGSLPLSKKWGKLWGQSSILTGRAMNQLTQGWLELGGVLCG